MRRALWIIAVLGLLGGAVAFGQEGTDDFDSLFETPLKDITEAQPAEGAKIDHTALFNVQDTLTFSGNFTATGGIGLGYTEIRELSEPMGNVGGSFLAMSSMAFGLDARPDSDLRIHGGFSISLEPSSGNYSWSSIAVDELFCDYTLLGKAFIRFGKHTITWGQGRLYTPGNLMDGSENGSAFRISFPTLLSGVSLVALAQNGYFADPANPSVREFAYGALADAVFGNLRSSFGLRYQDAEGIRGLTALKMNILGTDVFCDAVGRYNAVEEVSATTLLGFFREWKKITAYGEWQYDRSEDSSAHAVGAAVAYNNIGESSVDFGAKWYHAFDPRSGAVAVGVSWDPFKFVKATVMLPVVYGYPGKFDILDEDMPLTQRVSLVLLAKISASF